MKEQVYDGVVTQENIDNTYNVWVPELRKTICNVPPLDSDWIFYLHDKIKIKYEHGRHAPLIVSRNNYPKSKIETKAINMKDLINAGACDEGLYWFGATFGFTADLNSVYTKLESDAQWEDQKHGWLTWLKQKFPKKPEVNHGLVNTIRSLIADADVGIGTLFERLSDPKSRTDKATTRWTGERDKVDALIMAFKYVKENPNV